VKKFCPECGAQVNAVVMRLDEPTHAEPCGHYVGYDTSTGAIIKSAIEPGGRTTR